MRASLDTNVIIHFYAACLEKILFDFFDEGVCIYEQIREVELKNHAYNLLDRIDEDIEGGKIELYTDEKLKGEEVYNIFLNNVNENKYLYGTGDLGEVYAISLAQTLGVYSLVTDDIKQGGPYMSLLQFEDEVMPFTFADVLILRYIIGVVDTKQTIVDFETINDASNLKWSFRSQLTKFIRRFFKNPYRNEDKKWLLNLSDEYGVNIKEKIIRLKDFLE